MKRTLLIRLASIILSLTLILSLVACKGGGGNAGGSGNGGNKKKDLSKTQLYFHYYKAGYGSDWVDTLIANFEEAYKETSFEEGKTGVQVWATGDMQSINSNYIKENSYDVYQVENGTYVAYVRDGALLDISDIVTSVSSVDGKKIESKLSDQQQDGLKIDGKYYGIPHFTGNYGIIYNMDMWEAKGWWIADDGSYCAKADGKKLSTGPDGYYGTSDDGLPATFDEFFDLCDQIKDDGVTPYSWPQKYYDHYIENLIDSIVKNINGYEQSLLNYTFSGTATNLVDSSGNALDSIAISESNGYELAKQAGKYYGIEFLSRFIDSSSGYYPDSANAFGGTQSHTDNQQSFLMNSTDLGQGTPTAMLIDGPWWQAEAKKVFTYMGGKNDQYSKLNRNFGWMSLPKPNQEYVDNHLTTLQSDSINTIMFIKNGTTVEAAAKAFLTYAYSDASLINMTLDTGAKVGLEYDVNLSSDNLSTFSKDYLKQCQSSGVDGMEAMNGSKGKIIYEISSNDLYTSNIDELRSVYLYGSSIGGTIYKSATSALHSKPSTTAKEYFEAYTEFFKTKIAWLKD